MFDGLRYGLRTWRNVGTASAARPSASTSAMAAINENNFNKLESSLPC